MRTFALLSPAVLLLATVPAADAQEKPKANEAFRWSLSQGQVLDVTCSVRHQSKSNFSNLTVAGALTIDSVDSDGTAAGTWKIHSLSSHILFVNEQKVTYSGGRWTQVAHTRHVAFDANEKARKEAEANRDFIEEGKKWSGAGGTVSVMVSPSGFTVASECPVNLSWHLDGCWPDLKLPAEKGAPVKVELAPTRTGHLFASLKLDKSDLAGRWTAVGANPVYLDEGTAVARWAAMGGQAVVETLKYSRTTSASAAVGCVSKVSESFSVTSTFDGKPYQTNTGTFTLTIARKK